MHLRRIAAASLAVGLTLGASACAGESDKTQDPLPPASAPAPSAAAPSGPATTAAAQPSTAPSATPSAGGTAAPGASPRPGQTSPEKLDGALLQAPELPGWRQSEDHGDFADTAVEPAGCDALQKGTIGKVASDMGAMAGFTKDDLYLQEFLEVVDKGADSVAALDGLVSQCPTFTMVDATEKTPVTVSRFDAPGIGDRSVGIKLTMQGEAPVDMFVVVAGHRDVLLTTALQGEAPQPAMAVALSRQAMDKAKKSI